MQDVAPFIPVVVAMTLKSYTLACCVVASLGTQPAHSYINDAQLTTSEPEPDGGGETPRTRYQSPTKFMRRATQAQLPYTNRGIDERIDEFSREHSRALVMLVAASGAAVLAQFFM